MDRSTTELKNFTVAIGINGIDASTVQDKISITGNALAVDTIALSFTITEIDLVPCTIDMWRDV